MPSHLRGLEPDRAQMGVTKALWVVAFVRGAMQALQVKRTLKSAPLRSICSPPILKSDWLLDSSRLLESNHGT